MNRMLWINSMKPAKYFAAILFDRRHQPLRWVFLIAVLPFLFLALLGIEYGAFFMYIVPSVLCVIQFLFPTLLGWFIVLALYISACAVYGYVLGIDVLKLLNDQRPDKLINGTDATVFIVGFIVLLAISVVLWAARPKLTGP